MAVDLDCMVAKKIFLWTDIIDRGHSWTATGTPPGLLHPHMIPKFSTYIDLAFGILKHAAATGLTAGVCAWHGQWMASMGPPNDPFKWIVWKSETPEEAICRCAIKAVDEGVLSPVVNS